MNRMKQAGRKNVSSNDARWDSLVRRDRAADGAFVYSVITTGVYCRPSCGARQPRQENVRFFTNAEEAERAGFRACKRCKPKGADPAAENSARVLELCRLIDRSGHTLSLQALAAQAGISRFHLHRTFKAVTGMTPGEYSAARRAARMRSSLQDSASVTEAIYQAGYSSSSRFYEEAGRVLGMKPTEFRAGGAKAEIAVAIGDSSLGKVLVAQTERGVCAVLLGDEQERLMLDLRRRFPKATLRPGSAEQQAMVVRVVALIERPASAVDLPLDIQGTAFQKRVWKALQAIQPGKRATYSEIAAAVKMPQGARAIAGACAANPLAVVVPCHRVVRKDGALSGYRWGIERKRTLLEREDRATDDGPQKPH